MKPSRIRRLYGLNRLGVFDDALLDEVGWGLHARCRDALTVWRAVTEGKVPCPECGEVVLRSGLQRSRQGLPAASAVPFSCTHCGQALTWRECREALRNRPLCFDCLLPLGWRYAQNELRCSPCGKEWSWQKYRRSVTGRTWLPCPHCGERIRRPEATFEVLAGRRALLPSEAVACPRCHGDAVHEAGRLSCFHCGYEVRWSTYRKRQKRRVERLRCASCGHKFTWQSWRECYRSEDLLTGNPAPLEQFVVKWTGTRTPEEQMARIDALLHAVHGRGALGPVLIDGDEAAVMALLDELAQQR
ncbi:MAG: hypothetical protein ACYS8L_00800 [Planctomycetota bacterium]